jgi:hypothetical protein
VGRVGVKLDHMARRESGKFATSINALTILPSITGTKWILSIVKVYYKFLKDSNRAAHDAKSSPKKVFHLGPRPLQIFDPNTSTFEAVRAVSLGRRMIGTQELPDYHLDKRS